MDASTEPKASRLPLIRTVRRAAYILVLALIIQTLVIPQIGGARRALSVVGSVEVWMLGVVVVLEGLALLSYAALTRWLAAPEHEIGLGLAFATVLASAGVGRVVPGGAATTAAVNYRLLGQTGLPASDLGFVLGVQAIGSAVVLNLLLWLALLLSIPASGFHPVYGTAAAVGAALITIVAVAVIGLVRGRDGLARRMAAVANRMPWVDGNRVRVSIETVADRLTNLASDPRRLAVAVVLAALNWLLDAAALWVALAAFDHRPDAVGVLIAFGLANVIAAVPVSPGGLGVIEAVLIPTLVGFGTPRAVASVGVVAYRLVNFWLLIPVGALAYGIAERLLGHPRDRRFRDEVREGIEARSPRSPAPATATDDRPVAPPA